MFVTFVHEYNISVTGQEQDIYSIYLKSPTDNVSECAEWEIQEVETGIPLEESGI